MTGLVHKNKNKSFLIGVIITLSFCFSFSAQAAPDNVISYQGKLTNNSDVAVADGSYNFTLTIWDALSGGNCLWSARGICGTPTAKSVGVAKGIFSTYLGEAGDNTLSLDFNSNYFLEITIGADTAMAPRKKITAAGFAINAGKLNGQSASYYLDTSATMQTKAGGLNISGEVGIGTTDPNRSLEVYGGDSAAGYTRITGGETYDSILELYADQGDDNADKFDLISSAANNLFQIRNNTSALLTVKSGGNVGIGTTDPTAILHLKAGTATAGTAPLKFTSGTALGTPEDGAVEYDTSHLYFTIGSTRYQLDQQSGGSLPSGTEGQMMYSNATTWTAFSGMFWDDTVSRVGIGTTAPGAALDVLLAGEQLRLSYSDTYYTKFTTGNDSKLTVETSSSTQSMIKVGKGEAQDAGIGFDGNTNDYHIGMDDATDELLIGLGLAVGTTPYITIESNGEVGIGTQDPTYDLDVGGGSSGYDIRGYDVYTHDGGVTSFSDERLKNVQGKFKRGLAEITQMDPIYFNYQEANELNLDTQEQNVGILAQQLQSLIPEAVKLGEKGYLTVTTGPIFYTMINAIQELALYQNEQQASVDETFDQIQNFNNQTAGLTNRMNELQAQVEALKASYASPNSLSSEQLVRWSEMQGAITLAFEKMQAENDPTLVKILEMQNRINRLEKKIIAADFEETAPEEMVFQIFSEQTSAISSSLAETNFAERTFGGNYLTPEIYNEIRVAKINGLNLDNYNVSEGYLKFQIFLADGDNLSDFVTELGNEMDTQEIQWNLKDHPYFVSGWNEVSLKVSDGIQTGEIDWANLNYFRVYFKFQSNNQVRLKDIKLVVAKKTATALATNENANGTILSLNSTEENTPSNIANQQDLVNSLNDNVENSATNLAPMENSLAETDLLKSILGLDRVANASDVDILGRLSAESTESGQMLIKVNEEAKRTIGESALLAVRKDEDGDGLDDDTGSDGKKIFVKTMMVSPKSKIFVTSQKTTDQTLAVTSKISGSGFWVEVKNPLSEDLTFDWWMVEETGILAP